MNIAAIAIADIGSLVTITSKTDSFSQNHVDVLRRLAEQQKIDLVGNTIKDIQTLQLKAVKFIILNGFSSEEFIRGFGGHLSKLGIEQYDKTPALEPLSAQSRR